MQGRGAPCPSPAHPFTPPILGPPPCRPRPSTSPEPAGRQGEGAAACPGGRNRSQEPGSPGARLPAPPRNSWVTLGRSLHGAGPCSFVCHLHRVGPS